MENKRIAVLRTRIGAARRSRKGDGHARMAGRLYVESEHLWEAGTAYTIERVSRRRRVLRRLGGDESAAQPRAGSRGDRKVYHITRRIRGRRLLPVLERVDRDFTPGALVAVEVYADRIEIVELVEQVERQPGGTLRRQLVARRVMVLDGFADRARLQAAARSLRAQLLADRRFAVGDMFCGIGGTSLGFVQERFVVAWAVDWDRHAGMLYRLNFPRTAHYQEDVRRFTPPAEPRIDGMLATFPCDDASHMGSRLGLDGPQTGLFSEVARYAEALAPRLFIFLENVAALATMRGGRDREMIRETLARLGYPYFYDTVMPALGFVPQLRRRYYAVAFAHDVPFTLPEPSRARTRLGDILEPEDQVPASFDWSPRMVEEFTTNRRGRHSLPLIATRSSPYAATLTENGWKGNQGSLIVKEENGRVRKFTPREMARYFGFPDSYQLPPQLSWTRATMLFGNSVVVPVIRAFARAIREAVVAYLAELQARRAIERPVIRVSLSPAAG